MLNKSKRLLLGLLILLLVDAMWVSCSQMNKLFNQHRSFEKPFFITYVKTTLFSMYFLGILLCPSWREHFQKSNDYTYITEDVDIGNNCMNCPNSKLSSPSYVPIKFSGRSSGTESDDSTIIRSVRFKKLAEVRQMSEEDANEALLARLSYSASLRLNKVIPFSNNNKLSILQIAWISLIFCLLWFVSSYMLQAAEFKMKVDSMAIFSASAIASTLMLSAMFPSKSADRLTLSKIIIILVSVISLCVIAFYDTSDTAVKWVSVNGWQSRLSVLLTIISGFLCSLYVVFLLNTADHEDKLDIPLMFGFAGIFCLMLFWPGFFILHYFKWELFEWPDTYQWFLLLLNGIVGTMLSQVLWLWGCFLTSSLLATLALGLAVPMCLVMDTILFDLKHPSLLFIGLIPISLSFISITILTYLPSMDPIFHASCRFWSVLNKSKSFRISEYDLEQSESLITVNDMDSHEA